MIHPGLALLVVFASAALADMVFWPVRGLWWWWIRGLRATEQVLLEHALKHVFDCEYNQRDATLESLSGALEVAPGRVTDLVGRMEERGLLITGSGGYELTTQGRSYALRLTRVHRLWEQYLSEETGYEAADWHREADVREHKTTPEEADRLSARLGHPRYDPHGDPIPTPDGQMPPSEGDSLHVLSVGDLAEVIHLKDKPETVYSQLLAAGLYVGMKLQITESTPLRVRFLADGDERVLAPLMAAHVTGRRIERVESRERLSALAVGESGRVTGISASVRGVERRRLLDLGVVPGTEITAELRSASGDPTAYSIRGAVIALRSRQARQIEIEKGKQS